MRKVFYVSIIACLFLTSCEREVEVLENEAVYSKSLETTETKNGNTINNATRGTTYTSTEIFRLRMEWASFITARIIHESDSLKNDVNALIVNQTIPLEDLIGPNTQLENFHREFVIHLTGFIESSHCPGDDYDEPNKGVIEDDSLPTSQVVDNYLDYMLNQNCVELYFPIGILNGNEDIISLSHPLTNYQTNHAYQRQSGCISSLLTHVTNTHVYINQLNYTYIVARPVKAQSPFSPCAYNQFNGINFNYFLQGPF